ncbi:MAG: SET domain-containing protein-lysine N-methyltransferase [archaeon]
MTDKKPAENKNPDASKIVVRSSKVHGNGVFAARDIAKGEKVIEYVGRIVTKDEADKIADEQLEKSNGHKDCGGVYIFELNKKYDLDGNVEWNPARYINHSCDPNCETEGDDEHIWIEAMRDIKKREELSYDYCYDLDNWDEHPCKCGASNCVGYIVNEKLRGKLEELKKKR